jgi:hypothetical protein
MNREERYSKRPAIWTCKRPQPWTWAQAYEERVRKHWRWKLRNAIWENTKAQSLRCTPLSHYGWKAFGFDRKFKPVWTINSFLGV